MWSINSGRPRYTRDKRRSSGMRGAEIHIRSPSPSSGRPKPTVPISEPGGPFRICVVAASISSFTASAASVAGLSASSSRWRAQFVGRSLHHCVRLVFGRCSVMLPKPTTESPKIPANQKADARIRTADPFITRVDHLSSPVVPSRAKPHESEESARPRWRPKPADGKHVDPA